MLWKTNLSFESINYELYMSRIDALDALLNNMISILIFNALLYMAI